MCRASVGLVSAARIKLTLSSLGGIIRGMTKLPTFHADQFTPTQWDSAADKARFANHFARFVDSDFKRTLFPKWFYTRLSMTFGHIAHYDIHGFYETQFGSTAAKLRFLQQTQRRGLGSPTFTYSDVEDALAAWVRDGGLIRDYRQRLDGQTEEAERAELARLRRKYEEAQ